jgi:hypothetical protein
MISMADEVMITNLHWDREQFGMIVRQHGREWYQNASVRYRIKSDTLPIINILRVGW